MAMLVASLFIALLVIADLLRTNRVLIEESLERVKTLPDSNLPQTLFRQALDTARGLVKPEGPEV